MARQWWIEFEGAYYHILSRGNERRSIFRDNDDRVSFPDILGKMADRFEIEVYAYVLMDNHYHLLLKTNKPNISKSMQWFGATYTRRYNIKHKRSGRLFQGRFKNFIIEKDEYLMLLSCFYLCNRSTELTTKSAKSADIHFTINSLCFICSKGIRR